MSRMAVGIITNLFLLTSARGISAAAEHLPIRTIRVWLVNQEEHSKDIQKHKKEIQRYINTLPFDDKFRSPFQASFNDVIALLERSEKAVRPVGREEDRKQVAASDVIDVGEYHSQGKRQTMEDASVIDRKSGLYALFDGHAGDDFALFAQKNIPIIFDKVRSTGGASYYRETMYMFSMIATLEKWGRDAGVKAGATALVAHVIPSESVIHIANVGDSRALLIRNGSIETYTRDHKIDDQKEKERIEKARNKISRKLLDVPRVGGLALARTVGDYRIKDRLQAEYGESAIIAVPSVYDNWGYKEGDTLVLACDGLWDVMTNQVVERIVTRSRIKGRNAALTAKELVQKSLGAGSMDNVSVIVIYF